MLYVETLEHFETSAFLFLVQIRTYSKRSSSWLSHDSGVHFYLFSAKPHSAVKSTKIESK